MTYHFTGNRRGSVFRRYPGTALIAQADPTYPRIPVRFGNRRIPFPDIEAAVSRELRERFSFCRIRVDDAQERLGLERGLIALLSRHPLSPPSPDWLGNLPLHPAIRRSGLWNGQHVEGEPLDVLRLETLFDLAEAQLRSDSVEKPESRSTGS